MMNYPGVVSGTPFVLDKIWEAKLAGLPIDGHSPAVKGSGLDAYAGAGIKTDHECATPEELHDRIRRGMYVMLRQGSACRDLLNLLPWVNQHNITRCLFCTDDRQPKSILEEGHINNNVRMAIAHGMAAEDAYAIATINAADCYRLDDRGAIAPGRRADFLLVPDVSQANPLRGVRSGQAGGQGRKNSCSFRSGGSQKRQWPDAGEGFSQKKLELHLASPHVRVIDIIPGSVVTGKGEADVTVGAGPVETRSRPRHPEDRRGGTPSWDRKCRSWLDPWLWTEARRHRDFHRP
jgi:adenine deaminase